MMRAGSVGLFLFSCYFLSVMFIACTAIDTITPTQSLHDGQILVSSGGNFELGFFSPGSSTRRYVGIWFRKISTRSVVWVANRETPILDSSGVLQITNKSILVLVNGTGGIPWSTNASRSVQIPIAQLLDSGNLVVRDLNDESPANYLWQSFDYPCDSQLPGMKLGKDLDTGFERFLTSWKSSDDPSPGSYKYYIDPNGYPQPFLYRNSLVQFREGPWNGVWFSGTPRLPVVDYVSVQFVFDAKQMYYLYDLINVSVITYRYLNPYGTFERIEWNNRTKGWATLYNKPSDFCDSYGICGAFSTCNVASSPQCKCMKGFVPKSSKEWSLGYWAGGCVRSAPLNCTIHNGFMKVSNVKLPDTKSSWYNTSMSLSECYSKCLKKCSCVAYANMDVTGGGTGCLLWFDSVVDVKVIAGSGQDLYIRVESSDMDDKKARVLVVVIATLVGLTLLCGGAALIIWRRRRSQRMKIKAKRSIEAGKYGSNNTRDEESDLPVYDFDVIAQATNNFSNDSKLGEGGFGTVYKGILSDGHEIAVKRLSKDSRQGLDEFKNEVIFIAKLQHRNLVRLIGCCIEAEERLLIYEYMPNQSLDFFIFDQSRGELLHWPKRFDIIKGIARGLLYLHQDSRLRIVHRDLKASNILLDLDMNPKISDFGLARTFDGLEDEAKTMRVVGTYGYMPPEYTIDGIFSVKSDVFSFGVLLLEIVSGRKNRGFSHQDHHHNLVGHAWILFREGEALSVVDPSIRDVTYEAQMQRLVNIGLLCVQQHPEDRPTMSQVTVMLSSDGELPEPKEPGFYTGRNLPAPESLSVNPEATTSSVDEMTITLLHPR